MSIFSSLVLPLPLPLLLLTSFITPSSSASEVAFIYDACSQAKFTQGSAYESGVKSVLTSIVNAAMVSSYNSLTVLASSSSSSSSSQDIPIYGLFQCQGNLAASDCSHCVVQAVSQLGTICPDSTGGALQLDNCFIKYDDSKFLGMDDKTLVIKKCGTPDGFNSDVLTQRDAVLAYLETSDGVYKMFRTTRSGNLQGMAQCLGDLSSSDCQDCLSNAIERLRIECGPVQWGQIYLAKCYARYSEGGYYSSGGNGEHKNKNKKHELQNTLAITVGLIAGVALLIIFISFLIKLGGKEKVQAPAPPESEIEKQIVPSTPASNSSGPVQPSFSFYTPTSWGFQVIAGGPISVRAVAAAAPAVAGGDAPIIEEVE